jgi:hypothetical protein
MPTLAAFRRPVKPSRVSPRANADFATGLEPLGLHSAIDSRTLPTIEGRGLTEAESTRVTGAQNRARTGYGMMAPDATFPEIERVATLAATDELRRCLKDRPAAKPLEAKPASLTAQMIATIRARRELAPISGGAPTCPGGSDQPDQADPPPADPTTAAPADGAHGG